jgi:hypothetical protein
MAQRVKLKVTAPALSAERERLRQAIERREAINKRLHALISASESMRKDAWELQHQIDNAAEAIEAADQRAIENLIEREMNRPRIDGPSPEEARRTAERLDDQHQTMTRARTHLDNQRRAVQRELENAKIHVEAAVSDALWASPEVMRMLRDLEVATATALEIRAALDVCGAIPNALLLKYATINPPFSEQRAATWRVAKAKLMNDARAELPS